MKNVFVSGVVLAVVLSACVPQRQFAEMEQEKNKLQRELAFRDSLAGGEAVLEEDYLDMKRFLRDAYREVEQLRSTNQSLNRSYQELLQRYSGIVNENQNLANSATDRQYNLEGELDAQRLQLQQKEAQLRQLEDQLLERERRLNMVQSNYGMDIASKEQQILELQNELFRRDQEMRKMRTSLSQSVGNMSLSDMNIVEENGSLNISISQDLLFKSGSFRLDRQGRDALAKLATALKQNPDFDIVVEGHTDDQGSAENNWDLSVRRASAVVMELIRLGVAPEHLVAAGRGEYAPIADNATESGRAQNRRTEIILSPQENRLDAILFRNE